MQTNEHEDLSLSTVLYHDWYFSWSPLGRILRAHLLLDKNAFEHFSKFDRSLWFRVVRFFCRNMDGFQI
jgi:hypothetical protein